MTLICSKETDSEPRMNTYTPGTLSMEWSTSAACPRDGKGGNNDSGGGSSEDGGEGGRGGWGFWGFIKFMFWCIVLGLILYFGIGMSIILDSVLGVKREILTPRHVLQPPTIFC
jgi:hypothetical protein